MVGAAIWTVGFAFEFFADLQLIDHQDLPQSKRPSLLKTGLWRYSRHPNYFGEILCWWGIYIIACSGNSLQTGGALTIYSPVLITVLLLGVTGVPCMEKGKAKSKEYRLYMQETSCVLPWPSSPTPEKERPKVLE